MKKIHKPVLAALLAALGLALAAPAQAGQSEEQRYLIRKAMEAKKEKARMAAQQKPADIQEAKECTQPEHNSQAEESANAS